MEFIKSLADIRRILLLAAAAAIVMATVVAFSASPAFAAHDSAQPPGNSDQCQELGFYAADEKRPDQANTPQDAGQPDDDKGTNRAADQSAAVQNGSCSS